MSKWGYGLVAFGVLVAGIGAYQVGLSFWRGAQVTVTADQIARGEVPRGGNVEVCGRRFGRTVVITRQRQSSGDEVRGSRMEYLPLLSGDGTVHVAIRAEGSLPANTKTCFAGIMSEGLPDNVREYISTSFRLPLGQTLYEVRVNNTVERERYGGFVGLVMGGTMLLLGSWLIHRARRKARLATTGA